MPLTGHARRRFTCGLSGRVRVGAPKLSSTPFMRIVPNRRATHLCTRAPQAAIFAHCPAARNL
eukprot:9499240-Pyramimonas_sp.AAC.1